MTIYQLNPSGCMSKQPMLPGLFYGNLTISITLAKAITDKTTGTVYMLVLLKYTIKKLKYRRLLPKLITQYSVTELCVHYHN